MKAKVLLLFVLIFFLCCKNELTNILDSEKELLWIPPPTNSNGFKIINISLDSLLESTGDLRVLGAVDSRVAWISDWSTKKIVKTEDGGTSWKVQSPPVDGTIYCIEVIDSLLVYIGTSGGQILFSSDGGNNWIEQYKSKFINYIKFFDEFRGIAIGDAPTSQKPLEVLHTSNSGLEWSNRNTTLSYGTTHYAVSFTDQENGWIKTEPSSNFLYVTSNGGISWERIDIPTNDYINTLISPQIGVVIISCESANYLLNDYGATFKKLEGTVKVPFGRIKLNSDNPHIIYATHQNSILISKDQGKSWENVITGIQANWWDDISSPSLEVFWISGNHSKVTYTMKADSLYGL